MIRSDRATVKSKFRPFLDLKKTKIPDLITFDGDRKMVRIFFITTALKIEKTNNVSETKNYLLS